MKESQVGIRTLRQNASGVIRRVRDGEAFVVTDNGKPVAKLIPLKKSPLEDLIDAGLVVPATAKSRRLSHKPTRTTPGKPSASELLQQSRGDR